MGFVSSFLKDSERLQPGLDEMLDRERALGSRAPGEDKEGWLQKLSELEVQEERLLDLYLKGNLECDRYGARISELKRSRKTIQDLRGIRATVAHDPTPRLGRACGHPSAWAVDFVDVPVRPAEVDPRGPLRVLHGR